MTDPTAKDGHAVGRKQLNVGIDEGLFDVVERFHVVTGLPYTRIVSSALLTLFFDGLRNLEPAAPSSPDMFWVHIAMLLERDELDIEDVPMTILDGLIADADRCLRLYERGAWTDRDGSRKKEAERELKRATEKRNGWNANIEDFGGKMEAIAYLFKSAMPPVPPQP